jgi:hypothetical protein
MEGTAVKNGTKEKTLQHLLYFVVQYCALNG